jgi:hypothetical protein
MTPTNWAPKKPVRFTPDREKTTSMNNRQTTCSFEKSRQGRLPPLPASAFVA